MENETPTPKFNLGLIIGLAALGYAVYVLLTI